MPCAARCEDIDPRLNLVAVRPQTPYLTQDSQSVDPDGVVANHFTSRMGGHLRALWNHFLLK